MNLSRVLVAPVLYGAFTCNKHLTGHNYSKTGKITVYVFRCHRKHSLPHIHTRLREKSETLKQTLIWMLLLVGIVAALRNLAVLFYRRSRCCSAAF